MSGAPGGLSFSAPGVPQSGPLYFTQAGLGLVSQSESSGNPTATNPTSTASGLYGFTNPTWQQYAPLAGVDTSLYPTAASAPSTTQMQVAAVTPASNWLCTGCDARVSAAVAANPALVTAAPAALNLATATAGQNFSGGSPASTASSGTPGSTTAGSGGILADFQSWLSAIADNIALAVLALILLLIALWPHAKAAATKIMASGAVAE